MIVSYFYVINAVIMPFKANAPLVVDPDTVLSFPVSFQCLKVVCRRDSKVFKVSGSMDHDKLPFSDPLNILRQIPGKTPTKYFFCIFVFNPNYS